MKVNIEKLIEDTELRLLNNKGYSIAGILRNFALLCYMEGEEDGYRHAQDTVSEWHRPSGT